MDEASKHDRPVRVLISHAHDPNDEVPGKRAHWLFRCLREHGVDARIDFDEVPGEGWTAWMQRQIKAADYVLLVCTPLYRHRFEDELEPEEGGRGVRWEGRLLRRIAYHTNHPCKKLKPVLFAGSTAEDVPEPLHDCKHYHLQATWNLEEAPDVLEELLRDLIGQRRHNLPPLGPLPAYEPISIGQPAGNGGERAGSTAADRALAQDAEHDGLWQRLRKVVPAALVIAALLGALLWWIFQPVALTLELMTPAVRPWLTAPVLVVAPASRGAEREALCKALQGSILTACEEATDKAALARLKNLSFVRLFVEIGESGGIRVNASDEDFASCFRQLDTAYAVSDQACAVAVVNKVMADLDGKPQLLACPSEEELACKSEMGLLLRFEAAECPGATISREEVNQHCHVANSRRCFMAAFIYLEQCRTGKGCTDYEVVAQMRDNAQVACDGDHAALLVQDADYFCKRGQPTQALASFEQACKESQCEAPVKDSCAHYAVAPTAFCLLQHPEHEQVAAQQPRLERIGAMKIDARSAQQGGLCPDLALLTLGARAYQYMLLGRYRLAAEDYMAARGLGDDHNYTLGAAEALMLAGENEKALNEWLNNNDAAAIEEAVKDGADDEEQKQAWRTLTLLRWRASVRAGAREPKYRRALEAAYAGLANGDAFYLDGSNTLRHWLCPLPGDAGAHGGEPCQLFSLLTEPRRAGDEQRLNKHLNAAQ